MQKATATYVAPMGDSKVVEMGGVTFFDGKPVDLNDYEHPHLISKLVGNQYFDTKVSEDDKQAMPAAKKRGRPSAADRAAAKLAADEAELAAKAAAKKAADAKADLAATERAAGDPPPKPPAPPAPLASAPAA